MDRLFSDPNNKSKIGFYVKFADIDSILFNEQKKENSIPVSLIAKQLIDDLDIINAFKSLYNKYIDPNYASFMINISSRNRDNLTVSLDCRYFKRQRPQIGTNTNTPNNCNANVTTLTKEKALDEIQDDNQQNGSNSSTNAKKKSKGSGIFQLASSKKPTLGFRNSMRMLSLAVATYPSENESSNERALIDVQFVENNRSVEWLVLRLLTEMDLAAVEVSTLMDDTFARFKYSPLAI